VGQRPANSVDPSILGRFFAPLTGSLFAFVLGMNNRPATRQRDAAASFVRVVRGFAEASLVALAFACAILLIGMPIAIIVRGLHEALSWTVARQGNMSALVQAFVSVSSVTGGFVITAVLARLLVRLFHWRNTFRTRVISSETPHTRRRQEIRRAA
jgi:F0F1-type ATP synthase membrane subunit a